MIKLSIKFDLRLGKILLGFAGISAAVFAYEFYSAMENEEVTSVEDDDKTDEGVSSSELTLNASSKKSKDVSVNSLSSNKQVVNKGASECNVKNVKVSKTNKNQVINLKPLTSSNFNDKNLTKIDYIPNHNEKSTSPNLDDSIAANNAISDKNVSTVDNSFVDENRAKVNSTDKMSKEKSKSLDTIIPTNTSDNSLNLVDNTLNNEDGSKKLKHTGDSTKVIGIQNNTIVKRDSVKHFKMPHVPYKILNILKNEDLNKNESY